MPLFPSLSKLSLSPGVRSTSLVIVSGIAFISALLALQKASKYARIRDLKSNIERKLTEYGMPSQIDNKQSTLYAGKALRGDFDEEIILEQLARNRVFLGDEGLMKVREAFVIVVGLGGVGSWATTMLVRSGISHVRLIDFDQVTLSSLNRHAVATLEDVGTPKVSTMVKHLHRVAPWCKIDARNSLWTVEVAEDLLSGYPTFVVDAIDNIDTKVDLLSYCKTHDIPVISSMGAGCKSDPTRICVADISESVEDPLSRSTRRRLRLKGISTGIPTVFSTEKPGPGKASLLPLPESEFQKGKVDQLSVLPDFRVRILPVLGTMPGFFGLCIANHIITVISGYPTEYSPGKLRYKLYADLQSGIASQESRLRKNLPGVKCPFSENDIAYLVEEVFRGKSVVSGSSSRLMLTRWEPIPCSPTQPLTEEEYRVTFDDVVLMTKEEVVKHEQVVLKGEKKVEEVYGEEVLNRVKRFREEEKLFRIYR